jgi:hypothetical protein
MSRFPQKKATRGSQRWIQIFINERPDILKKQIGLGNINWLSPLKSDEFAEYRDKAFLDLLGISLKKRSLSDFWPSRGPQWDALGMSEAGETILVEAKAHVQEIFSPPTNASPESLKLIHKSLAETASAFRAQPGIDWSRRFYQYANRLAHAFLLQELNDIPTRLLFIYFTGDSEMNGPETVSQWQAVIESLHEELGIKGRVPAYILDVFIEVHSI